jgi:hypothetical protein
VTVATPRLKLTHDGAFALDYHFMHGCAATSADRTPVVDIKPWQHHFDVPGWPTGNVGSIRAGWYQRINVVQAGGLQAGRPSLERTGVLRPQSQEEVS